MRACSLLTCRSHSGQFIWSHRVALSEGAHAELSTFICDFLLRRFCLLCRHERLAGSRPVCTVRSMGNLYPPHYRTALAFSGILCPPPCSTTGLTVPNWLSRYHPAV